MRPLRGWGSGPLSAGPVSIVVVSHNGRDVLGRCLGVVAALGHEVIVVDNASTDGSIELVRERFPAVRLLEPGSNLGFGAANNLGLAAAAHEQVLLLNSDAWPVADGIERLQEALARHPGAALVGPRLRNPDGSLQRSVRGFPSCWRLATEFLFLRKLGARTRLLNAFYAAGFDHATERAAEFLMGAVLLARRDALLAVGGFDERFFMFSEEVDLCLRLRRAGWETVFTPTAEFVHLGGGSTRARWGTMYREQLRAHLVYFDKHGGAGTAERARAILLAGMRLRSFAWRGERRADARAAARWLASGGAARLIEDDPRRAV